MQLIQASHQSNAIAISQNEMSLLHSAISHTIGDCTGYWEDSTIRSLTGLLNDIETIHKTARLIKSRQRVPGIASNRISFDKKV